MRLFNPVTMTEVLPGFHDITDAIELPENNWFFVTTEIPEGMQLSIDDSGAPILVYVSER